MRRLLLAWVLLLFGIGCLTQSQAFWQSRNSNYNKKTSGGGVAFSITWVTSANIASFAVGANTFTSVNLGSTNANRVIVVGFIARNTSASTVSSMTIDGVSATQVSGAAVESGTSGMFTDIWYALVNNGDTIGTIVVNATGGGIRSGITVYNVITATTTPTGSGNNSATSVTSLASSVTVPAGGGGITIMGQQGSGSGVAWTGATAGAGDYATAITSEFASATASGTGSVTMTAAVTGGTNNPMAMSSAAWGQ